MRGHPDLRPLVFSNDPADQALIHRLLTVSRGHPLILDRLARLAADPADLTAALDRVQAEGWQRLPDLFGGTAGDQTEQEAERAYREDVAIGSVDLLIERLTPEARRLLRVVTLANEPVSEGFIDGVWRGRSAEDDPRKQQVLAALVTDQGKELMEQLKNRTPKPESPPVAPLLDELRGSGLLTREEPEQGQATYGFHELVRERMTQWRSLHADAADDRDDDAIRIGYGERYAGLFDDLYQRNRQAAGEAGRRALVRFCGDHRELGERGRWRGRPDRGQAGETVAEAPDRVFLGRVLVGALDIAWWANLGLSQWQACLDLVEEQESAQRDLGEGELGLAFTRFNQSAPLLRLGRLDEAQRVLEGCLGVFRSSGAVSDEARCLSALADLWDQQGEIDQAIALQRLNRHRMLQAERNPV